MVGKDPEVLEMQKSSHYPFQFSPWQADLDYLVCEWVRDFDENPILQKLVLNRCYDFEDGKPRKLNHQHNMVWYRSEVVSHLAILNGQVEKIRTAVLIDTTKPETELLHDVQRCWAIDTELRELVDNYRSALETSLYEFNKQYMLARFNTLSAITSQLIPDTWGEKHVCWKQVRDVFASKSFNSKEYNNLDIMYHNTANRLYTRAAKPQQELGEHPLGQIFIIPQDIAKQMVAVARGTNPEDL